MPERLKVLVRADGMTLEDLYVSQPLHKSKSIKSLKQQPIALTPRSAEACFMEGIDPHDLYDRDLDSFAEHGLDPAIVRMVSIF
jgi:hypothetical protein